MSALAEALGNAVPHEFIDEGKTYKVNMVTPAVQLAFEKHMWALARETARDLKDLMSVEEFERHIDKISKAYQAGGYSMKSDSGAQFIATPRGVVWLIMQLFGVDDNTALDLLVRREQELSDLVNVILCESIPAFRSAVKKKEAKAAEKKPEANTEGAADPNAQAPAPPPA
jgi:hypothetical protein